MSVGTNSATVVTTYKDGNGTVTVKSETVVGDYAFDIERTAIDAGATHVEFDVPVTVANIKAFGMGITKSKGEASDKTAAATVKINSTSSPSETLSLTPANGIGWSTNDTFSNPLATDITKFYVSNTGTGKIDFLFRALIDSTPSEID